ncbi:hypothetical protein [Agaricicola taiwanensis]|nr:hypothetical protein [Agaricicola taiwanensis]
MKPFTDLAFPHNTARGALAPLASDHVDARVLEGGSAETHVLPPGASHVIFSATGDFFAAFGTADVSALVPTGAVTDGAAAMLNPAARRIPAGATHIGLAAAQACIVTMEFYGDGS